MIIEYIEPPHDFFYKDPLNDFFSYDKIMKINDYSTISMSYLEENSTLIDNCVTLRTPGEHRAKFSIENTNHKMLHFDDGSGIEFDWYKHNLHDNQIHFFGDWYVSSHLFSPSWKEDHLPITNINVYDDPFTGKGVINAKMNEEFFQFIGTGKGGKNSKGAFVSKNEWYDLELYENGNKVNSGFNIKERTKGLKYNEYEFLEYKMDSSIYSKNRELKLKIKNDEPLEYIDTTRFDERERIFYNEMNRELKYNIEKSINLNFRRKQNVDITFNNMGDTQKIIQPTIMTNGVQEHESFVIKNNTHSFSEFPETIKELFTIKVDSKWEQPEFKNMRIHVKSNNGNTLPIDEKNINMEEKNGEYIFSIKGKFYYDHKTKKITDILPPEGHNYDIFINELPPQYDDEQSQLEITIDFDLETYDKTNIEMKILTGHDLPIRNHDDAKFNIVLDSMAEFNDIETKPIKIEEMKHISEITKEFTNNHEKKNFWVK